MASNDAAYTVERSSYRGPRAVATTPDAFLRAMTDKVNDPTLEYDVVERVVDGRVRASYVWRDGRWC